eukprot:g59612.t1
MIKPLSRSREQAFERTSMADSNGDALPSTAGAPTATQGLHQNLWFPLFQLKLFCSDPLPVSEAVPITSEASLCESYRSVDQNRHSINDAFIARSGENNSGPSDQEVLLLTNPNFPCDLKATEDKKIPRLEALSELKGLASALLELSLGVEYRCSTSVNVDYVHPDDLDLFRPGADQHHNRKWDISGELVEGTADGERTFLRATFKAATVAEMLKDKEATISLARLLKIVMRILRTGPDKQRRATCQKFSQFKLMQNSDQHTGSKAESDAAESDEHATCVSTAKLSEAEAKIQTLMDGDKEAKRVVDDSLSLLDDERKAKLKALAELLELRKTSANDRASLERNLQNVSAQKADLENKYSTVVKNYDNLLMVNKTTNKELRREVTDLKKQVAALEQEESQALQLAGKEKASLLSQLGNLKNKIAELEGLLEDANAQLDESQAETASLKDKYKAVKEDLNTAKAEARANVRSKRDRSVDYVHPDDLYLFRPGADQHHNRKWDISGELVEGTADGERTVWLPKITLNGEDINVGDWLYFLRATFKAATVAEMLKDKEATISLARLLKIVMRILRTGPDNQRRATCQKFSQFKLMQNSDQHTGSKAESDAAESDEHATCVSTAKLSEAEAKIQTLMDGDKEAKRVVDDSLSLLDDERKAKLKALAELLELRKTSANDRASLERNLQNVSAQKADLENKYSTVVKNYDNLLMVNKTTNKELRREVTDLKKQVAALEQEESQALQLAGKEKASLLSQLGNLKNKIAELEGLLEDANAQLDESQAETASLKDKYKAVKEDLNTAKAEARGKSADTCLAFTNNLLLFVHVLQLKPMSEAKGTGLSLPHLTHVIDILIITAAVITNVPSVTDHLILNRNVQRKSVLTNATVDYVHPDDLDLFRPGADQHHNRKWDISGELVEGTADGERTVWLPKITLNGEDINVGDWLYFLRATFKAATVAEMLKDKEATISLARLLKIVMRILRTGPDKQRRATCQKFSQFKLMQNSDQHTGSKAESDAAESDEHATCVSTAKLSEAEAKIQTLMDGDKEAKRVVDDSLSLLDDERKAKLKALAELLELRKTSANDRASLERNLQNVSAQKADLENKYSTVVKNYDNLLMVNKTTNKELRREVTDLKKQVAALEQEESQALQLAGKEKASLLSQLGNLKNKIAELEGLLEDANAQLNESQAETASLKDKYKAVKEDLNTAKAEARANVRSKRDRSVSPSSDTCHRHSHHYRGRHYKRAKCDRSSDSESECTKKISPNKRHGHH